MRFLIRDDDPCFFTKIEELESCYSKIYNQIPICLSVTPFRIASKYFKTSYPVENEMPLHFNKNLTEYLKENVSTKRYDIALHGYNHIYYNDKSKSMRIPEYSVSSGLYQKTKKAKSYLESTLETSINTFVPPSNSISLHGYNAMIQNNLNIMHSGSYRLNQRPLLATNFKNFFLTKLWNKKHKSSYPYIVDFGKYKELSSVLLYPSSTLKQILNQLQHIHQEKGVFVLATHYHAFQKKLKSGETIEYAFNKIIEKVMKLNNIEFITYKDLW